jgi:hypothetical protein
MGSGSKAGMTATTSTPFAWTRLHTISITHSLPAELHLPSTSAVVHRMYWALILAAALSWPSLGMMITLTTPASSCGQQQQCWQ